jgi:hypothetical protein
MGKKAGGGIRAIWIVLGCLVGVPLILCGGVTLWWMGRNAAAQAKLDEKVLALSERGMPVDDRTMAEFHATLTDDLNAARWLGVLSVVDSKGMNDLVSNFPVMGAGPELPAVGQPWEQQDEVAAFLDRFKSTVDEVHEIAKSDMPVRFPIDFQSFDTLLPNAQGMRGVARLLVLEHAVAIRTADSQREFDAINSILGTSIALRGEPIVVSTLVSIALHGIGVSAIQESCEHCNLTDAQLKTLDDRLRIFDAYQTQLRNALAGERAMALPAFQNPGRVQSDMPNVGARPIDALYYLNLIGSLEEASDKDLNGIIQAGTDFQIKLEDLAESQGMLGKFDTMLTSLVTPAMGALTNAYVRDAMSNRLTRLGIGVRRYQLAKGAYPATLADLEELGIDTSSLNALDGNPFGYSVVDGKATLWGYDLAASVTFQPNMAVPATPPPLPPSVQNPEEESTDFSKFEMNKTWVWQFQ